MTPMPARLSSPSLRLPRARSSVARLAVAALAILQIFVGAVVPFADARPSSIIGPHAEQQGGRRHYVHDEAYCAACVARHIVGTTARPSPPAPVASLAQIVPPTAPMLVAATEPLPTVSPRAPPVIGRVG